MRMDDFLGILHRGGYSIFRRFDAIPENLWASMQWGKNQGERCLNMYGDIVAGGG